MSSSNDFKVTRSDSRRPRGPGGARVIPPPPFIARSLRLAALDHLETYRRLFTTDAVDSGRIEYGSDSENDGAISHGSQSDIRMKRKVIRGLLLLDISRLMEASTYLQNSLRSSRLKVWYTHGTIALISHAVLSRALTSHMMLSIRFLRGFLSLLPQKLCNLVPFISYPLAGYYVVKIERQISCTAAIRARAKDLFYLVEAGQVLEDRDVECFTNDAWNSVPWGDMESDLG